MLISETAICRITGITKLSIGPEVAAANHLYHHANNPNSILLSGFGRSPMYHMYGG